ncbi:MAG TPA: hypothetical protein PLO37_20525 [Candidatus Hydrogenedentes bacterium]|nr:hypothetical protein [Candidatus Hydrogenedentota bacterium]HPG69240.1 hypothetical protein [Candidatus Hydrogenedentota bacterium]
MEMEDWRAVKAALRQVLEEEMGAGRCAIARRWEGGTVVLKPADSSLQPKEIPMETFFKKIVSVREKLRVLEQKINNHGALTYEDKLELQQLISRAYGSLTTFNVLFREEEDRF